MIRRERSEIRALQRGLLGKGPQFCRNADYILNLWQATDKARVVAVVVTWAANTSTLRVCCVSSSPISGLHRVGRVSGR